MPILYSLDDTIDEFFESHRPVTRRQCDDLAIALVGGPVNPVPIQGSFSYTIVAGPEQSSIVQFRDQSADLDAEILDLARLVHGELVAAYTHHGQMGHESSSSVSVWVMDKLPGTTYIKARSRYSEPVGTALQSAPQHVNTVAGLARFFAQAWNTPQRAAPGVAQAIHDDYRSKLALLSDALPQRFRDMVGKALAGLPALFTPSYPLVLSHGDLNELNMLVDPDTGRLTGVVDWAEASIAPFGVSLWGLENLLGHCDSQGWHYHSVHRALEDLFWQTFEQCAGADSEADRRAIRVARVVGCLLRYGF